MSYSLNPQEVKKVIDAKLNNKLKDANQFLYYHLHRNHFNVGNEITSLRQIGERRYVDNLGHEWQELSTLKNYFHMPKWNWIGSSLGLAKPYSRKFLRPDDISGIGGEFEMIIRHDGKRVDALTHETFQETYNYGRTSNTSLHIALDVNPHNENPNYSFKQNMGWVKIVERTTD